ncbi:MAG: hypothetical protein SNH63_05300 [Rikenellaceae bacterium]
MNRYIYIALFAIVGLSATLVAQPVDNMALEPVLDGTSEDRMEVDMDYVDSLINDSLFLVSAPYLDSLAVDSLRLGWGSVVVRADSLSRVVLSEVAHEPSEGVMGYRVGLFFDNGAAARSKAAAAVALCDSLYADVLTTLSYDNPYFKVSAGYCTTLEEALMLLQRLQRSFPSAFLINERILPSHIVEVRNRERDCGDGTPTGA